MVHSVFAAALGTVGGTILGVYLLFQFGLGAVSGLGALVEIFIGALSGSLTAAPLGVFSGVTGGILGALIGVAFAVFPLGWLFIATPLTSLVAAIIVAGTVSAFVSLLFPH